MRLIIFACLLSLNLFSDRLPNDAKPIAEVIEVIEKAGYTEIKELEYEDGVWKADVFLDNKKRNLTLHPKTGEIIQDKGDNYSGYMERVPKGAIPLADLVKSLNKSGYIHITEISLDGGIWEVDVYVDNGKKELFVDVKNGKVLVVKDK